MTPAEEAACASASANAAALAPAAWAWAEAEAMAAFTWPQQCPAASAMAWAEAWAAAPEGPPLASLWAVRKERWNQWLIYFSFCNKHLMFIYSNPQSPAYAKALAIAVAEAPGLLQRVSASACARMSIKMSTTRSD